MTRSHDDFERMIVRRLDGELGEEESLELDRAILREPEVRRMWESYRRIDELAAASLEGALVRGAGRYDMARLTDERRVARRWTHHRGWLLVPGAIAAALLALVVPKPEFLDRGRTPSTPTERLAASSANVGSLPRVSDRTDGLMHNAGMTKRATGRDVLGVVGDDGNLYLLEVDRSRTVRMPPPRTGPVDEL